MPGREKLYTVGNYFLSRIPESPNYYIFWYDERARHEGRKSTRTSDFQRAVEIITEHHARHYKPAKISDITVRHIAMKYYADCQERQVKNIGQIRVSLDRLTRFISWAEDTGLIQESMPAEDWTRELTREFVTWIYSNPYYKDILQRDSNGKVVGKVKTPRPVNGPTVDRCLSDVRAAFRFSLDRPPIIKLTGAPTRGGKRKPTLTINHMVEAFDYAWELEGETLHMEWQGRQHLQAYLIAAITTLGRPDAILDISVVPEREQIEWDYRLLHLNPAGREQTRKRRPTVPINDYLLPLLQQKEQQYFSALRSGEKSTWGYLVEYRGAPMISIGRTWSRMKRRLGWPMVRDWDAKMIRHTMSKWLRAQGVPWPELQGHLGHAMPGETEIYAEYDPKYLGQIQAAITRYLDEINARVKVPFAQVLPKSGGDVVTLEHRKHK